MKIGNIKKEYCCTVTEQEKNHYTVMEEDTGLEDELLLWMMLTPIFKGVSLQGPPNTSHYLSPHAAVSQAPYDG